MSAQDFQGRFTFVLHSHLPYVLSHGNWPHGMVWLSEAAAETYVPLWRAFRREADNGKKLAVTIGFSPILTEQLRNSLFIEEFHRYLEMKLQAAEQDYAYFSKEQDTHKAELAEYWRDYYSSIRESFVKDLKEDIVGGFKELQDCGAIEIITCGATHGYLPLLGNDEAVNAQIEVAVKNYQKHFGRKPKGIWLPECAYRPGYHWVSPTSEDGKGIDRLGVEHFVQKHGLRYFIVDSHLLKGGKALGTYLARFEGLKKLWDQSSVAQSEIIREEMKEREPYKTYWVDGTVGHGDPVGILTRDSKTSLQVWSGEYGYPGDGHYLEFHKKQFPGGHRYWAVTRAKSDLGEKEDYFPEKTHERVDENALHFTSLLRDVLKSSSVSKEERFVISPFDTELFGHWWFEGTEWIAKVLESVNASEELEATHGCELIENTDEAPVVALPEGSWGEGGFHYIWLNDKNAWSWKLIHECESQLVKTLKTLPKGDGELEGIAKQLGRELLLLEASDWQFLISTFAAADYAELRLRLHYNDFQFILSLLERKIESKDISDVEWERYQRICERDSVFEELDLSVWQGVEDARAAI